MTEISSWWGVILICHLRFSKEQLIYCYLPVGVETKTKHPPSSTKLLGTSSPYDLHLKFCVWFTNLQVLPDHVGNYTLMLMIALHHQQNLFSEGLVPSLPQHFGFPPAQPSRAPCEDVKTHPRWTSVTSRCPDARHSGSCWWTSDTWESSTWRRGFLFVCAWQVSNSVDFEHP